MNNRFAIRPKVALGDVHIGSTLNTVLRQCQSVQHNLIYSRYSILTVPYIIQLPSFGIQLIFNQNTQRLIIIEILSPSLLELSYQDKSIKEWNIKKVYNDEFGPTYKGIKVESNYVLSYPGISFKFEILEEDKEEEDILSKLLLRNSKVLSIALHPYKQYTDWESNLSCSYLTESIEISKLIIDKDNNIKIKFLKHSNNIESFSLYLGKSNQQDILCTLGPPDDTFIKNDNRTQIHSTLDEVDDGLVFHNYYHFGFDLLYSNLTLIKIIIHNNSPLNKLLFGKYEKCLFEIELGTKFINGDMSFKEIKSLLKPKKIESIILNRSNKIIGRDIELIDYEENEEESIEIKSLCIVDEINGFNWDVFGGSNEIEPGAEEGVVDSLTIQMVNRT